MHQHHKSNCRITWKSAAGSFRSSNYIAPGALDAYGRIVSDLRRVEDHRQSSRQEAALKQIFAFSR